MAAIPIASLQFRPQGENMASGQRVAIITGASKGIGACLLREFRERGYVVVANSRSMKEIEAAGDPETLVIEGDISLPETADRIVAGAIGRFGRIDTLVNNAGIFIAKPFTEFSEADFANTTAVNLAGFFHLTQRVAARMLEAGSGHIVNVTSSLVAEQPLTVLPAALTALTKGGLIAVTRALAIEYASRGIRVNAVSPAATRTPMHSPEMYEFLAGLQPMGRMGEPQEIVDAILYLENAGFVTGEVLHVDGGANAGRW
jgi:NAD(P)-dependent dehydrogenase (short-subunit alcohol dehydrogenase family)